MLAETVGLVVYVAEVAAPILVHVLPSGDDCHWIDPTFPLTETVIALPLQIVGAVDKVTVPETEG